MWRLRAWREGDGGTHVYPSRNPSLYENQAFEGAVLGYAREGKGRRMSLDLYRDPFRAVRLSDSGPVETFLNRLGVFHPHKDTSRMVLLAETFRIGTRFALTLRYHEGLSRDGDGERGVSMPIPPEDLVRALRDYYGKVAEWEEGFAEEHRLKRALEVYRALRERLQDPEAFPSGWALARGGSPCASPSSFPRTTPRPRSPRPGRPRGPRTLWTATP